jgi:2-aminoadipate transaminase
MKTQFANRIHNVPKSFIREILKVATEKEIISFAGGLPNPGLFPVEDLQKATLEVFRNEGNEAMQYSNSEGYIELRKDIARYYRNNKGLTVKEDEILITTGSQQALDLLGKVFINEGDKIIIEEPGYLGAIQAFSMYNPKFMPVPLNNDGMDSVILAETIAKHNPQLIYVVPNFQNPSGISYSAENRKKISDILKNSNVLLIEDDPYGELRFKGNKNRGFKTYLPEQTIMLGTFSKTVVPSFRIGWVVAPSHIMEKLIVAKQAADLHTNFFCQRILHQYFTMFDNNTHIHKVSEAYGRQRDAMIVAIRKYFPENVQFTEPEGGMFLWVTLPEGHSSMELLNKTMKRNVVFVPGNQFYTNRTGDVNTFRLNFSCANEEMIEKGIRIIGEEINRIDD